MNVRRIPACFGTLLLLSGCVSVPRDAGIRPLYESIDARLGAGTAASLDIDPAAPLTPASATRIALVRSPRAATELAELGLARADLIEASQLPNPRLSLSLLDAVGGSGNQLTRSLEQPVATLLLAPSRRRLGEAAFAVARDRAAHALIALATDVEAQWFRAVAAAQIADLRDLDAELADASAELAARYHTAGNLPAGDLAEQRSDAAQAATAAERARTAAERARRRLALLIGLDRIADGQLPDRLPRLPANPALPDDVLAHAQAQRLDLAAAKARVAQRRDAVAIQRRWRFAGDLDLGIEHERESDGARWRGPTLAWSLPLFDQGQSEIARAEADLALVESELAALEASLSHGIALALAELQSREFAVDQWRRSGLPAHAQRVAVRATEQQWMLIGPFEAVADRRAQFAAWIEMTMAVRDWWLARSALRAMVGGGLPDLDLNALGELSLPPAGLLESPAVDHNHHAEARR